MLASFKNVDYFIDASDAFVFVVLLVVSAMAAVIRTFAKCCLSACYVL